MIASVIMIEIIDTNETLVWDGFGCENEAYAKTAYDLNYRHCQ